MHRIGGCGPSKERYNTEQGHQVLQASPTVVVRKYTSSQSCGRRDDNERRYLDPSYRVTAAEEHLRDRSTVRFGAEDHSLK